MLLNGSDPKPYINDRKRYRSRPAEGIVAAEAAVEMFERNGRPQFGDRRQTAENAWE